MATRSRMSTHRNCLFNVNAPGRLPSRRAKLVAHACLLLLLATLTCTAQDVPNSKDPVGMKRYEGSELIGYRAPRFDEYVLPLGPPTNGDPPTYEKSKQVEGQVSYYTYLAPAGRSPAE